MFGRGSTQLYKRLKRCLKFKPRTLELVTRARSRIGFPAVQARHTAASCPGHEFYCPGGDTVSSPIPARLNRDLRPGRASSYLVLFPCLPRISLVFRWATSMMRPGSGIDSSIFDVDNGDRYIHRAGDTGPVTLAGFYSLMT
ncbi:hypothetical protein RRG08_066718 [Elysia crispata]|uniref:Uncharacterized protein n=1 Tax=Elysia crispata TaxID=231223 RepID=A0AAE1B8Q0_9GAST|nr:hypothetical protein RRG08_066718 [Elysia crispata]